MTAHPDDTQSQGLRNVALRRTEHRRYTVTNERGGTLTLGAGDTEDFTPVELLVAAIAGCASVDVDVITSRRAEPTSFEVAGSGEKFTSASEGGFMDNLRVTFDVTFPEGEAGDKARAMLQGAIDQSQRRLCTVSRTVARGAEVRMGVAQDLSMAQDERTS